MKISRQQLRNLIRESTHDLDHAHKIASAMGNDRTVANGEYFYMLAVSSELAEPDTLDLMDMHPGTIISFVATEELASAMRMRIPNSKKQIIPGTYPPLYKVAYLAT